MKPTIKDVARLAGVSFKTVSRVINNEPSVKGASRSKVWKAVKQLDYHPNLSARHLRGAPSSIAFIYDNPNSNYIIEMQQGILDQCRQKRFELVIHPCDSSSPAIINELLQVVFRSGVGGLILTPPLSEMPDVIANLNENEIKQVRIVSGSSSPDDLSLCVYVDDRAAAFRITQHLIDQGYRQISFFCGDPAHASTGKRLQGYKEALQANDLEVDENLILPGRYSFESGAERAKLLLDSGELPSAIFGCNDEIAAGAMFYAQNHGVHVPQQLAVAGFEDNPFSRHTWPRLTTARQDNNAIAQRAAELLIALVYPGRFDIDVESGNGFEPQLVIRDSTATKSSLTSASA